MVSLAEFDLLQYGRQDVRLLKWTQPKHREAMRLHFKIKQAHEEIERLNVEIQRLITFMFDDHVDHYRSIQELDVLDPNLAHELSLRWEYLQQLNSKIVCRLVQTSRLSGFTGIIKL